MNWNLSGLAVQGSGHLQSGTPCQDAQVILDRGDGLVLAVADGAGSARYAELGAAYATARAVAWFQAGRPLPSDASAWESERRALLLDLRAGLAAEAARLGCAARDLACTLLLALVTPAGVAGLQVGDGAIVWRPRVLNGTGPLTLLTTPQRGEYLNETLFLVSDACLEEATFAYREGPVDGIVLLSDGLQMLALDMTVQPPVPHAPFFEPLLAFVRDQPDADQRAAQLRAFLESARVCARTDDDKTLAIAIQVEPS